MRKAFGDYQRLARGPLGMSSLWTGGDHLLYIKGNGFLIPFSEEYKRFRYSDIQGLVMARTAGLWLGAMAYFMGLAVAASLCFALLFYREPGDVGMLAFTLALPLPVTVLLLTLLIRHLLLGPRCVCEVQTAVKREILRPVTSIHQGREILHLLGERARASQTGLSPAENSPPPATFDVPMRIPPGALPAFLVQSLAGILLLILLHVSNIVVSGFALATLLVAGIPLLIAVAGGVRHLCPEPVRQALWFQLSTLLIIGSVSIAYLADQAINDPSITVDLLGPVEAFAAIPVRGGLAFYLIFLFGAIGHLAVAATGIFLSLRWSHRAATTPTQQGQVTDDTLS